MFRELAPETEYDKELGFGSKLPKHQTPRSEHIIMKPRLYNLLLLILFCMVFITGCGQETGTKVIEKDAGYKQWSKDGKSLFYQKDSRGKICRYDISTGKKRFYKLPHKPYVFDVSPDGKSVVYPVEENGIYITELETGRTRKVFSSNKRILLIWWLYTGDILFPAERHSGNPDTYVIPSSGHAPTKFLDNAVPLFCSLDGNSFIYQDLEERIYLYDMKKKTGKSLNIISPEEFKGGMPDEFQFLYLDNHKAAFVLYTNPKAKFYSLDLATMCAKQFELPDSANDMRISPDLTHYWWTRPEHQDTTDVKMYLVDIPLETAKKIGNP